MYILDHKIILLPLLQSLPKSYLSVPERAAKIIRIRSGFAM